MLPVLDKIINETCKDRGIDRDLMIRALEQEVKQAAINKYGLDFLDIAAEYNEELGQIGLFHCKTVTENAIDTTREISITDAQLIVSDIEPMSSLVPKWM